jgi:hypothetical protein
MFGFRNKEATREGTSLLTVFAITLSVILVAPLIEDSFSVQHEQKMMQNRTHQMLQNDTDNPLMLHEQKMMQNRTHQMLQNDTDNPLMLHEQKMMQNRTHQMPSQ